MSEEQDRKDYQDYLDYQEYLAYLNKSQAPQPVATKPKPLTLGEDVIEGSIQGLPLAGAVGGGLAFGPPGAVAGAGLGKATENLIQYLRGKYQPQTAFQPTQDVLNEMGLMAVGEGVGKVASKALANPKVRSGIAKVSGALTGTPQEAIMRLMERPKEVVAEGGKSLLDLGTRGKAALEKRAQQVLDASLAAREKFAQQFGDVMLLTEKPLAVAQKQIDILRPSEKGLGRMTPKAHQGLINQMNRGLTTEVLSTPVTTKPSGEFVAGQMPEYINPSLKQPYNWLGPSQVKTKGPYGTDIVSGDPFPISSTPPQIPGPAESGSYLPVELPPKIVASGKPQVVERLPMEKAKNLQKFADQLKNTMDTKAPAGGVLDPALVSQKATARLVYDSVKDLLHTLDPQGLKVADDLTSQFLKDKKLLKGLTTEETAEAFIKNVYGPAKEAQRNAVARQLPGLQESILDKAAYQAFDMASKEKSGARKAAGLAAKYSVPLALGGYGSYRHDPTLMLGGAALGGATAAATSPLLLRSFLSKGLPRLQSTLPYATYEAIPWFNSLTKEKK